MEPSPSATDAPAGADRSERVVRSIGGYQPGLDGVRALAVLAVAAYHAQLPHTSGGFLGVSLFFTLSGFLITALLLDEHERNGRIDLRQFWLRRFRRLVPAALLGLAVALVFAATIATRAQLEGFRGEVVASAGYFANWYFAYTDQSYTELFSSPSPVQHYWSLAIEEQFYLVMPLILIGVLKVGRSVRAVLAVLAAMVAASTAWMVVRFEGGATIDRLYYGTDTRATELLVGAALAAALHLIDLARLRTAAGSIMMVIGPLALAGLVWAWASQSLTDSTLFRGGFLLHALTSAVLIVAILIDRGPFAALLKVRPLAYLGRISYGIYLFHWPIFLWLTEDRTGLDQWPLFGLRLILAIGLAATSYALVEQPIRSGQSTRFPTPARLIAAPLAAAVLIGGAQIASTRDAVDEAETIRVTENSLGLPIATADGVLDILAIGDPAGADVLADLSERVRGESTVRVVVGPPLACTGGVIETAAGTTCATWATAWPLLISEHDPDVVVIHASDWPDLTVPGSTGDPADDAQRSTEILDSGLDLLTSRNAPVLWLPIAASIEEDTARSQRVFTSSLKLLERRRDDLHSVSFNRVAGTNDAIDPASAVSAVLEDAALYQRSDRSGLPKVLVVGDSQALSMGFGLQRWGDTERTAWVWNRGAPGCPFSVDGTIRFLSDAPLSADCVETVAAFDRVVEQFDPDLVIALPGLWDLLPRRLDTWDDFKILGDPEFDAYLGQQLSDAHERLAARGATVVWMTAPCVGRSNPLDPKLIDDQNTQRASFNDTVLADLIASTPDAQLFYLDEALCPNDEVMETLPSGEIVRYDGLHFSVEGAEWFAATFGPTLLDLANV
jgi:peptidoglycan/LPS O-acetylase OafA/YrhL